MWQIVYHPTAGAFEKVSGDIPKLHGPYVRIKPDYIGVCGSDKSILSGKRKVYDGLVIGHEITGKILEGHGLDLAGDHLKEGDRVVVFPNYYCGECEDCRHGHYNTCKNKVSIGVNAQGALQEFFDVDPKFTIRVDDRTDPHLAPLIEPVAVAVHAIRKFTKRDRRIIIIGGGSVGISSYITARHLGFNDVRIVEKVERKQAELKEHVSGVYGSLEEALGYSTDPVSILDTVGSSETMSEIERISEMVASGSEFVISGLESQEYTMHQANLVRREMTVRGSIIYTPQDFVTAREILYQNVESFAKTVKVEDAHAMVGELRSRILNSTDIKLILKI